MTEIKQEVRQFYDQVGWQRVGQGRDLEPIYQNAHYEDLRPVSRQYIHRCHLRVARYLRPSGQYLLDAGSGPVQYPEYLEYSRGYRYRVCADISITALKEARQRVGEHGLYVVADVANLPFKPDAFDGVVSLHTIHHLPEQEHLQAYRELYRVLAPGSSAAVVNGWPASRLMQFFDPIVRWRKHLRRSWLGRTVNRLRGRPVAPKRKGQDLDGEMKGTFTSRHDVHWIRTEVGAYMPIEVRVWRSVSVRFLRALIRPRLGGRAWLRLLFALEDRFPRFFGENGQYPLMVIRKDGTPGLCKD